jgi:D-tyrosyl-tRNA(Tyr) deacylase
MRVVLQRVLSASIHIETILKAEIGTGLLIFLGVEENDDMADVEWLCAKILQMRIFNDEKGLMNINIQDAGGELLVVSQFTLHASTKKGNRPSFIKAARPEKALDLYQYFIATLQNSSPLKVSNGVFGADMKVHLINDGPVTIWIDSKDRE